MHSSASQSAPDAITASLRWILRGLLAGLGMWRLEAKQACVMYGRIGRIFRRIERMLVRFRAGKLRQATPREAAQHRHRTRQKPAIVLPRRFGWLVVAGKHEAVCFGGQLKHLLNEPEMAALVEASPQARIVLRPLLRALAVELPWTVTQPRPSRPRKPRKPRPKPEPFNIKLPRGVITWAKREKRLERARAEMQRVRARA